MTLQSELPALGHHATRARLCLRALRNLGRSLAPMLALCALLAPLLAGIAASQSLAPDRQAAKMGAPEKRAETPREDDAPMTFETAFKPLGEPAAFVSALPGAVDLDTIEPPTGPQIVRSLGTGIASFYGRRFHGRRTANGERFDMNALTAAHKTLPFGTHVRVTNPKNGRSVTVRINDRGPFIRGRTIDLSRSATQRLGLIRLGHASVELDIVAP